MIDVDVDTYVLKPFEWFSSQYAPARASALEGKGRKLTYDPRGTITQSQSTSCGRTSR